MSKCFFIPISGGESIGGSFAYLYMEPFSIIIDAGRHLQKTSARSDFDEKLKIRGLPSLSNIDIAVVSHAHYDHIGGLLDLLSFAPSLPIIASKETFSIAIKLFSSWQGLNSYRKAGWERLIFLKEKNVITSPLIQYDEKKRSYTVEKNGEKLIISFISAGHIPGSLCFKFETKNCSLIYTGDFNDLDTAFEDGIFSERSIFKNYFDNEKKSWFLSDYLIMEGTYIGKSRVLPPVAIDKKELLELAIKTVSLGGKLVIPVFALARSQEVLSILLSEELLKNCPNVKIYEDISCNEYTKLYKKWYPSHKCWINYDNIVENWRVTNKMSRKGIYIISPGVIAHSPTTKLILDVLSVKENAVILTGYQPDNTIGSLLLSYCLDKDLERTPINIANDWYFIKGILRYAELSAHAHQDGIDKLIERVLPKHIILTHRHESLFLMEQFCKNISHIRVSLPKDGEKIDL